MGEVSLEDVLELAARQSPALRRARLARSAAEDDARAAGQAREWVASGDVAWSRQNIDRPDPEPVQLTDDRVLEGRIGLSKQLPTGGAVSLQLGMTRRAQVFDVIQILDAQGAAAARETSRNSAARAGVEVSQPIGRGLASSEPYRAVRRARAERDLGRYAAELAAEEAVRAVVVAYWELAFAAQAVDVAERSLALARRQLDQIAENRRAGLVAPSALKAVEYQLAVREETLLRARVELRARSLALRRLVALDVAHEGAALRPTERFALDRRAFDLEAALARSAARHPELAQLGAEQRLAELDLAAARDRRKPQLDLSVGAALVGNGADPGSALGNFGAASTYEISARLSLAYELGGARSAGVRAAEKRHSATKIGAADRRARARGEVITAYDAVIAARQRVGLAEKAIALAGETLDSEQASFAAGRSTTYSVLDRQAEIVAGELSRARAIADYHQAVAQLELLTGDLLERHGIELATP